ncbi:hypothetical protein RA19_05380 [Leisingera sp. ANG-M1]|nr:hypothetical protein RA19_05380 [Leisingera sp. ANG-M1]
MSSYEFLKLGLGALLGGFVNGLAGFGTELFSLGFFLQVMPPLQAVSTTAVLAIATGRQGLWNIKAFILPNKDIIARFLLPALPGIPIGTALAAHISPAPLKVLLAALLFTYGIFSFKRPAKTEARNPLPAADYLVGFAGGILGGLASLSGVLPTMWCSLKPWEKHKIRASLQAFNFAILTLSVLLFALQGAYSANLALKVSGCLLAAMSGAILGIRIFNAVSIAAYKNVLVTICLFVSGLPMSQSLAGMI